MDRKEKQGEVHVVAGSTTGGVTAGKERKGRRHGFWVVKCQGRARSKGEGES